MLLMWKQNKYFRSDKIIYQLFGTKWLLFRYPHECIDSMMIFWQYDVSSKVWLEGMFWSVDIKILSLIKVHGIYFRMQMKYDRDRGILHVYSLLYCPVIPVSGIKIYGIPFQLLINLFTSDDTIKHDTWMYHL